MSIWAVIVGIVVAIAFGVFKQQKKKKQSGATKIIIVNDGDGVGMETGTEAEVGEVSVFKRILTALVSAAAGFAAAGVAIVFFIEPEIGPVDPTSPIAIILYVAMTAIIYGVIRRFSRT